MPAESIAQSAKRAIYTYFRSVLCATPNEKDGFNAVKFKGKKSRPHLLDRLFV
jgi:hypothetical protein